MTQGMRLQLPVYLLTDCRRPSPNFLVDTTGYATTLYAWTDMAQAVEYVETQGLRHFDVIVVVTELEFRGILSLITDLHTSVEWVQWDPLGPRRRPRRYKVKSLIQQLLKVTSKENG